MPLRRGTGATTLRRIAGQSLWYATAGAVGKVLALLSVPFLTRTLGPAEFGLMDLSTATAGVLAIVAMFAGDIPSARLAGRASGDTDRRQRYSEYVLAVTVVGVLIAFALLPATGFIASTVWSSPGSEDLVALAIVLVPVSATRSSLVAIQRLEDRPKTSAMLATLDVVAQLTLAVAFVAIGLGPVGAVVGFLGGSSIALLVSFAVARPLLTRRIGFGAVPRLIALGAPFLPGLVAFLAADYAARAIVADQLGQSGVGVVGVAIRLASVLALLSAAFQLAWGPQAIAMDAGRATARSFGAVAINYTVVGGIVAFLLSCVAPEVITVMSGSAFLPGAVVLPGLAAAAVMGGTHFVMSMGAGVIERSWIVAASSLIGAAVQVLVTLALISPVGVMAVGFGAAAGRATSVATLFVGVGAAFDRRLGIACIVLAGVGGLCLAIGILNSQAADSFAARAALALLAAGIGLGYGWKTLAAHRSLMTER